MNTQQIATDHAPSAQAFYFKESYPAREAVCVRELPLGASIELSVIASK